jgi:TRAP transporter TAXI family solute receptor
VVNSSIVEKKIIHLTETLMKIVSKIALCAALGLGSLSTAVHAAEFITVLTGGTSGAYFPIGTALSKFYGDAMPNTKVTVQSTKASAENLNLVQAGRGELAFALGDAVSNAWQGNSEAGFPKKLDKLRGIAGIYPNYIQIAASEDSGIKTLADLKGKRVAVGAPKSGTELNARALFKAAGMSYDDFAKVEYLSFGQSVELMKNRQIDATLVSAGLGVAAVKDLSTNIAIRLIPITPEVIANVGDSAYQPSTIPANTYSGQTEAVPTAAIRNILVTNSDVSDQDAYTMTKELFAQLPALHAAHKATLAIDPKTAALGVPVPLHPGAERYYREAGLIK